MKIILRIINFLVLDCDNTLWGGVAGEDGINKLNYNEDGDGKIFAEIQKHLKKLKKRNITDFSFQK